MPSPQNPMRQSSGQNPKRPSSPGSQIWLPQKVVRQSIGQLNTFSPGSHRPLPQNEDWQSRGQLKVVSPGSQTRFPQRGKQYGGGAGPPGTGTQKLQSCGQLCE